MSSTAPPVNVTNITVLDNPSTFTNPLQFEIVFECTKAIQNDLNWKIIYVGSAESDTFDQELESVDVGPVPLGTNKFVFQADAPQVNLIPREDLLGVTVILITCSYNDKEFIRVGYYVNTTFIDENNVDNPPPQITADMLKREILASKPRVTRFSIKWDSAQVQDLKF